MKLHLYALPEFLKVPSTFVITSNLLLKPYIDLQFEERPLPTAITQGFTFDDVKFSYPESDTDVLKVFHLN